MKILIATDAWWPQVNGVVQTLDATIRLLRAWGHEVEVVSPDMFRNAPLPSYPEIRLALPSLRRMRKQIAQFAPDHVHVATEGPVGWAMRRVCMKEGRKFSTCYHTRFPEYLRERWPVPLTWSYATFRRFHKGGQGVMVATQTIEASLAGRGFANIMRWGRGADITAFKPAAASLFADLPRPIFLSVGRLAPEKNVEAFLALDLPGSKVVVGDGPSRAGLEARFPDAVFLGGKTHAELPEIYASADVFVFPSLTDTFGLVLVEAMACGLPVAAYPAPGPLDVIGKSGAGVIATDLREAALAALHVDRRVARQHAENFTWVRATEQFLANIRRIEGIDPSRDDLLLAAE